MVQNPKAPIGGQFQVGGIPSTTLISEEKQVVNVGYMREKCRLKNNDLNLEYTYRVLELPDPSDQYECVHKKYCDENSGKQTGGGSGNIFAGIFGGIFGAVAGTLASLATQGIGSVIGSLTGTGAAALGSFAGSLFNGGMRVGSAADLDRIKTNNPIPNEGALIDNLKDDIANRPQGQPDVGSLVSGAMSVTGLFRAVRNAQIGLFDLVN